MPRDKASKRVTKRLTLTYSDGVVQYNGITSNISATGVFIRTRNPFPPGTNIRLKIETDKGKDIVAEGVVVWALKTGIVDFKNGMGVRLTNIPEAYKELLMESYD
ncbi:MAG: hypothetical protein Fur0020_00430 [Thermodesulfovibrionia bacterium]